MSRSAVTWAAFAAVLGWVSPRASGDAIVVNQSMQAPTIVEFFVTKDGIRAEMEIGFTDIKAFRNILPDELFEKLGLGEAPLKDRFGDFYSKDLVILADGEVLVPALNGVEGKERTRRDEITGEVLPSSGEEPETVLLVSLEYAFGDSLPKTLTIRPPGNAEGRSGASIGFVLYHESVAVNDFRYLGIEVNVDLDWGDPWYSKFRHPNMKRQFDAPLRGFLYVEPFEVRKEIIARPRDLEEWIDLGLEGKETITASERKEILEKVGKFLEGRCPVSVDGKPVQGQLDRIHFVRRSLRQTSVISEDDDAEIPVVSATIGAIVVYPITGLPQEASMEWDLFTERTPAMRGIATDEAGGLPWDVTPDDPMLVWKNYLKNPTVPGLVEIAPPPAPKRLAIPLPAVAALLLLVFLKLSKKGTRLGYGIVLVLAVVSFIPATWWRVANPLGGDAKLDEEASTLVTGGLLKNIYRAFDFREESDIYDSLEMSVSGDLLTDVYLEVQRALQLENQGGASTKVKEVEIIDSEVQSGGDAPGFVTKCQWRVVGSVGHWGHIHERKNRYDAELTVGVVDGEWKLMGLKLLGEERL